MFAWPLDDCDRQRPESGSVLGLADKMGQWAVLGLLLQSGEPRTAAGRFQSFGGRGVALGRSLGGDVIAKARNVSEEL